MPVRSATASLQCLCSGLSSTGWRAFPVPIQRILLVNLEPHDCVFWKLHQRKTAFDVTGRDLTDHQHRCEISYGVLGTHLIAKKVPLDIWSCADTGDLQIKQTSRSGVCYPWHWTKASDSKVQNPFLLFPLLWHWNWVPLKLNFSAEFMMNLSIQKFSPFPVSHHPIPLRIKGYQRKGRTEVKQGPVGPFWVQISPVSSCFLFVEKGFGLPGPPVFQRAGKVVSY